MIKLTDPDDKDSPFYIAPGHISYMFQFTEAYPDQRSTTGKSTRRVTKVVMDNRYRLTVKETPEEIKNIASVW